MQKKNPSARQEKKTVSCSLSLFFSSFLTTKRQFSWNFFLFPNTIDAMLFLRFIDGTSFKGGWSKLHLVYTSRTDVKLLLKWSLVRNSLTRLFRSIWVNNIHISPTKTFKKQLPNNGHCEDMPSSTNRFRESYRYSSQDSSWEPSSIPPGFLLEFCRISFKTSRRNLWDSTKDSSGNSLGDSFWDFSRDYSWEFFLMFPSEASPEIPFGIHSGISTSVPSSGFLSIIYSRISPRFLQGSLPGFSQELFQGFPRYSFRDFSRDSFEDFSYFVFRESSRMYFNDFFKNAFGIPSWIPLGIVSLTFLKDWR